MCGILAFGQIMNQTTTTDADGGGDEAGGHTYLISLDDIWIADDCSIPEDPQEIIGGKWCEQVHVQCYPGTFQWSETKFQKESIQYKII